MQGRTAALLLAVALAIGAAFLLGKSEPPPPPLEMGQAAPGFELQALDGSQVSLASLRGHVVLLNFWATWCPPCEQEMPAMERLHKELGPQGFDLVAVSVDDSRKPVEAFRDRLGLTFRILLDTDKDVSDRYQSYRFPESYLIDANGVLVARYVGARDWDADAYVNRIRRLMTGEG